MTINKACMDRILGSQITGERIAEVFQVLENTPHIPGATLALMLSWQQPQDEIKPGDTVPTLTFTLRAPTITESNNAGASGTTVADPSGAASK